MHSVNQCLAKPNSEVSGTKLKQFYSNLGCVFLRIKEICTSESLLMSISAKGSLLSFYLSKVNLIFSCIVFNYEKKESASTWG